MDILAVIQPLEVQGRLFVNKIELAQIESAVDNANACNLLKEVADFRKSAEALEKELCEPHKTELDVIKKQFKAPIDFAKQAETLLREKINAFLAVEAKRVFAEQEALKKTKEEEALKKALELEQTKKEADKFDEVTKQALIQSIESSQNQIINDSATIEKISLSSSVSAVRMIWDFEVEILELIPTEFIQANDKAIREAIRNGARDISGIKIFQKPSVAIK